MISLVAVVDVPGKLVDPLGIVTKRIGRGRTGSTSIFPFRFGWQTVIATRLGRQPFAVHPRGQLGHADRRVVGLAHSKGHVGVGLGGVRNGIRLFFPSGRGDLFMLSPLDVHA